MATAEQRDRIILKIYGNNIRKFGKNILFYVLLYLIDTRLNVNVIEHL